VTTEVIAGVLATVHRRLGSNDDDDATDDALVGCVQLSLGGPRLPEAPARVASPLEVSAFGMSLQAATFIDGRDRPRLERMCRVSSGSAMR